MYIEIKGCQVYVGEICGNTPEDARFSYAESYMENPETVPVSLSLPFSDGAFSPVQTKNFFPLALMRIIRAGSLKVLPNDTGQVFRL